jgi:hypothetical protein
MLKKHLPLIIVIFIASLLILASFYGINSASIEIDFHNDSYVGASKCKECHEEQFNSWRKTYHSTMTQEANAENVQGNFDSKYYTYWGITVQPQLKNGKYYFNYFDPETKKFLYSLEITRTVGSRRYQQYLAKTENTDGNYYRLELLWHILDKRWVHLNGAFLGNDHQAFDSHTGIWNQNCIFCHNTGIKPNMLNYDEIVKQTKEGKPLNLKVDSRFDSHVSDLGIACESCHANGEEHIKLNQNPIRRYFLRFTDTDDKSIVNPHKLTAKKSMDVCGQCHGQRTPKTYKLAREWMEKGPSYRPGDNLEEHVNPVLKKSQLDNKSSDIFKLRFWEDGTPRLSAYEYQGLKQSKCHIDGDLTCNDCHNMHEGNPKGMITKENLTNKACESCHQDLVANPSTHTKHKSNSDGSLCYNCHMPKIVYGVMAFHRSHKIESPSPRLEFTNNKPNSCSACHLDKTDKWIHNKSIELWPSLDLYNESFTNIIQVIYKLHSGDPVERAIAANNLSYTGDNLSNSEKLFLIPHLLLAMEDDYPAIRRFSLKSLNTVLEDTLVESNELKSLFSTLESFDFISNYSQRDQVLKNAWGNFLQIDKSTWAKPPENSLLDENYILDANTLFKLKLQSKQESKNIQIGE